MVQVNTLTSQDMFHNPTAVQGAPSYIIQAPAGQTYIIQQPAGSLVRQTHTEELTAGSDGIDGNQHDQVMVLLELIGISLHATCHEVLMAKCWTLDQVI